jgi:hypothetical protein
MIIIESFNVEEKDFVLRMETDYPRTYTQEGLKLIYKDIKSCEERKQKDLIFRTIDIRHEYEEDYYQDFLDCYNLSLLECYAIGSIPVDGDIDSVVKRQTIEAYFENSGEETFIGFTNENTVVYKTRSASEYVVIR